MQKKLTISLVTFNGEQMLPYCLQSIRAQKFQDFDLVIFDNNSTDATRLVVSTIYPEAILLTSEENSGFAAGHNTVIRESTSPYVCVLNQDVVLDQNYLLYCIQRMEISLDLGAVQGKILRVKELTHTPYADTIDTCGIALNPFFHHFVSLGENAPKKKYTHEQKIFGVVGTAPVYRKQALDDCAISLDGKKEYFDEDFFMYKEDVDLAYRLCWRGWRALVIPSAFAYHIRTAKSASLFFGRARPEKVNEWSYRNHFFVLMKNISARMFVRYFLGIVLYECLKVVYHGIRTPRMVLLTLKDGMRMRHRMSEKRIIIFSRRKITDAQMRRMMQ